MRGSMASRMQLDERQLTETCVASAPDHLQHHAAENLHRIPCLGLVLINVHPRRQDGQ